jgi:hypothetical protein
LAIDALETSFFSSIRISLSLPSSSDDPYAPLTRQQAAFGAGCDQSLLDPFRYERSLSTAANSRPKERLSAGTP